MVAVFSLSFCPSPSLSLSISVYFWVCDASDEVLYLGAQCAEPRQSIVPPPLHFLPLVKTWHHTPRRTSTQISSFEGRILQHVCVCVSSGQCWKSLAKGHTMRFLKTPPAPFPFPYPSRCKQRVSRIYTLKEKLVCITLQKRHTHTKMSRDDTWCEIDLYIRINSVTAVSWGFVCFNRQQFRGSSLGCVCFCFFSSSRAFLMIFVRACLCVCVCVACVCVFSV